jgi:hypothetical protein
MKGASQKALDRAERHGTYCKLPESELKACERAVRIKHACYGCHYQCKANPDPGRQKELTE